MDSREPQVFTDHQRQYGITSVHRLTSRDSRELRGSADLPLGTVQNHEVHLLTTRDSREKQGSTNIPLGNHKGPLTYPKELKEPPGSTGLPIGTVGNHQVHYLTSRGNREPLDPLSYLYEQ